VGNFGEVSIWRFGEFGTDRQIKSSPIAKYQWRAISPKIMLAKVTCYTVSGKESTASGGAAGACMQHHTHAGTETSHSNITKKSTIVYSSFRSSLLLFPAYP
jgi:hypothetical protein